MPSNRTLVRHLLSLACLGTLRAQTPAPGASAATPHPSAAMPGALPAQQTGPRDGTRQVVLRTPSGELVFESSMDGSAPAFSGGYFGMPIVVGPYSPGQQHLRIIRGSQVWVFEPEKLGFKPVAMVPLPPHPAEPSLDWAETAPPSGVWTKERRVQAQLDDASDLGYQLGADDDLYWVGHSAIYRRGSEGWKLHWAFPKEFLGRRKRSFTQGGVVVLPDNRLALFGGEDAFVKVIELRAEGDPKVVFSVSYDSVSASPESYPFSAGPQFCVAGGFLYFHLRRTGCLFRLNLESGGLTRYDAPWTTQEFSPKRWEFKWKNPDGDPSHPVVPQSLAFTVNADGSLRVHALMYNLPMGVVRAFDLGPTGSTIKAETLVGAEQEPLCYVNPSGDLTPWKSLESSFVRPRP